MDAIILAGGTGSRLKPSQRVPKPLVMATKNKTLLDYQINSLEKQGFDNIIISTSQDIYENYHKRLPKHRMYALEPKKLGTGGGLKLAMELMKEDWAYVINVDDFLLMQRHDVIGDYGLIEEKERTLGALYYSSPPLPFSILEHEDNTITKYTRSPRLNEINVSVGHYILKREVLEYLPYEGDFEDVIPLLVLEGRLEAYPIAADWITVNDAKQYKIFLNYIKGMEIFD